MQKMPTCLHQKKKKRPIPQIIDSQWRQAYLSIILICIDLKKQKERTNKEEPESRDGGRDNQKDKQKNRDSDRWRQHMVFYGDNRWCFLKMQIGTAKSYEMKIKEIYKIVINKNYFFKLFSVFSREPKNKTKKTN